jgi:hypothetical protein
MKYTTKGYQKGGVVIVPNKPITGSLEVQLDGLKVFRLM